MSSVVVIPIGLREVKSAVTLFCASIGEMPSTASRLYSFR